MRWFPVLVLAACGGGFNAPFSDKTLLADLTADEVCELQEAAEEWALDSYAEDLCTFFGQIGGAAAAEAGQDFTAACEAGRDECIADIEPDDDTCEGQPFRSDCTATVGDAEDCYNDFANLFAEFARSGCDPLTDEEVEARREGFEEPPASCQVSEACEDVPVEG